MENDKVHSISPLDGRYSRYTSFLKPYFTEYAFMKYRVMVEVEYFLWLSKEKFFNLPAGTDVKLKALYEHFSDEHFSEIKNIERQINHDVKAVEIFLKHKLQDMGEGGKKEWFHFGLTSQDINNTSISLIWSRFINQEYYKVIEHLNHTISNLAKRYKHIPMLSRTHGQPASTTTVGKELMVFYERIQNQMALLRQIPHTTKFGGAVGNMNAHFFVFPDKNWINIHDRFVEHLGLERQRFTTQIEHYDNLTAKFDTIKRINIILIDFSRDIWTYISEEYFNQKINTGEVGSSTMPHKVNPIDFENAEGNFGIANALYEHFSNKLPISRLQRDLSDSTVVRNIGLAAGHTILGLEMLLKGLSKIDINKAKLQNDLDKHPEIIAEGIQMYLRTIDIKDPYEVLKTFTRNNKNYSLGDIYHFINSLNIDDKHKERLREISPSNYIGKHPDF